MGLFRRSPLAVDRRLVLADRVLSAIAVLLLIDIIALPPLLELGLNRHVGSAIFVTVLALGAGVVFRRVRGGRLFIALSLTAVALKIANIWLPDAHLRALDASFDIAAFGVLTGLTLRVVFAAGPVTGHRLMGALAGYLMVALIFFSALPARRAVHAERLPVAGQPGRLRFDCEQAHVLQHGHAHLARLWRYRAQLRHHTLAGDA